MFKFVCNQILKREVELRKELFVCYGIDVMVKKIGVVVYVRKIFEYVKIY